MKKTYQSPRTGDLSVDSMESLLGVSGYGIPYGGVDTGGTKDPSARRNIWDDEDEEEE